MLFLGDVFCAWAPYWSFLMNFHPAPTVFGFEPYPSPVTKSIITVLVFIVMVLGSFIIPCFIKY